MGAPELPGDPCDEDFSIAEQHIQHAPMPSDESDENDMDANAYEGYVQLAMDEHIMETNENDEENEYENAEVTHGDSNLPAIDSADVEIERQVWSAERPAELQIELDTAKTQQILTAMAGFTLPNVTVPEWAAGVPEELWKNNLLERIRQRKEGNNKPTTRAQQQEERSGEA